MSTIENVQNESNINNNNNSNNYNTINNHHDTVEPQEIILEQSCTKTRKIIIGVIISIIILCAASIISYFLFFKKNKDESNSEIISSIKSNSNNVPSSSSTCDDSSSSIYDSSSEEYIADIFYEKKTLYSYSAEKKINSIFSSESNSFSSENKINYEYLFLISDEIKNEKIFEAYAIIKSKNNEKEDFNYFDNSNFIFNDSNSIDSNYALCKFYFYKNGTIKEINFPEKISQENKIELNDFINLIIPTITKKTYEKTRNLSENNNNNIKFLLDGNNLIKNISKNDDFNNITKTFNSSVNNKFVNVAEINEKNFINSIYFNNETENQDYYNNLNSDTINDNDTDEIIPTFGRELLKGHIKNYSSEISNKITFQQKQTNNENITKITNIFNNFFKNNKLISESSKNFRNLDFYQVKSLSFPISLGHELFSLNFMGHKISLKVHIHWISNVDVVQFLIYLNDKENKIYLLNKTIDSLGYKNIISEYDLLINAIIAAIEDNNNEFNKINMNEIKSNISNDLKQIEANTKPYISIINNIGDLFFENFLFYIEIAKNESESCMNSIATESRGINIKTDSFLYNKTNGDFRNLTNYTNLILNESENSLKKLINDEIYNLNNITNSLNNFNSILNNVNDKDFLFKFNFLLRKIENLFSNFEDKIKKSVLIENYYYQKSTNEEVFYKKFEELLKNIDELLDIFYFNKYLTDSITDDHASAIIFILSNIRKNITIVKNVLLKDVENHYENYFENNFNSENKININLSNSFKIFNQTKNNLNNIINQKINNNENISMYLNNLNSLQNIFNILNENREKSFNTFFIEVFNEIETNIFTTKELENEKKNLKLYSNNIISSIKKNNITSLINYISDLELKINELLNFQSINEIILNKIFNKTYIQSQFEKYYKEILNYFEKYEELINNIINNNLKYYLNKPNELLNQLTDIKNNQENIIKNLAEKLSNLIEFYIKNNFLNSIAKLIGIINDIFNDLKANCINHLTGLNKYLFSGLNDFFIKKMNEIFELYQNYIENSSKLFMIENKDFIDNIIKQYENNMTNKLIILIDKLNNNIDKIFCNNSNECITVNFNQMQSDEKYDYNSSLLRSHIENLYKISISTDEIINKTNLKKVESEKLTDAFKSNYNYDYKTFISYVLSYFDTSNEETYKNLTEHIEEINSTIDNNFNVLNPQSSKSLLEIIIYKIFSNSDLLNYKFNLLGEATRALIYDGYVKDLNYYKNNKIKLNISNKIDITYEKIMDDWIKDIKNVVDDISNNFTIPQNLIDKISNIFIDEYEKRFYDYKSEVQNFFSNYSKKTCVLLNFSLSVEDIALKRLETLKERYKSDIKEYINDVLYYYKENEIKYKCDNFLKEIRKSYDYYYQSYYQFLMKNDIHEYSSENYTENLTENIYIGFKNGINKMKDDIKLIYNTEGVNKIFDEKYKNIDLFSHLKEDYDELDTKLISVTNDLTYICESNYILQEENFKREIYNILEKIFNSSINTFTKGLGKSYLNSIYTTDTDIIKSKLSILKNNIDLQDKYINEINNKGFKNISDNLYEILQESYTNLNEKLDKNIEWKIEPIIFKKLYDLKVNSSIEIAQYFENITINTIKTENLNKYFTDTVVTLLKNNCSSITYSFISKLERIYKNIFDENILNNIKTEYNASIKNSVLSIKNEINSMKSNTLSKFIKFTTENNYYIINNYSQLNSYYKTLDDNYKLESSFTKLNLTEQMFLLEYSPIKTIVMLFNGWQNGTYSKVKESIKEYFDSDIEDIIKNEFVLQNTDYSLDKIKSINKNFTQTILLLFENFTEKVRNKSDSFKRNLNEDFQIYNIYTELEEFNDLVKKIGSELLTLAHKTISKSRDHLNNSIASGFKNLDIKIKNFLNELGLYLQDCEYFESQLRKYRDQLYNKAYNYYLNQNYIIGETIYQLSKLENAFEREKYNINNIVNDTLNTIGDEILNRFSDASNSESYSNNNSNEYYHFSNYLGEEMDFSFKLNEIKYKWAYNLKKFNNKFIFLNFNLSCEANANISYKIGEYETKISGVIGKGIIGINSNNNFVNQTVNANYFLNKNEIEYNKFLIKKHYKDSINNNCPNSNNYYFDYLNEQNVCVYDEILNKEIIQESENNININRVF